MSTTTYLGTELDAFSHAGNWKQYLREVTSPYLRGHVLEVGGGIGTTTSAFRSSAQTSWTALEPDPELAMRLARRAAALPRSCSNRRRNAGCDTARAAVRLRNLHRCARAHREGCRRTSPRRRPTNPWRINHRPQSRTSVALYGFRRSDRTLPTLRSAQPDIPDTRWDNPGRYAVSGQRRTSG